MVRNLLRAFSEEMIATPKLQLFLSVLTVLSLLRHFDVHDPTQVSTSLPALTNRPTLVQSTADISMSPTVAPSVFFTGISGPTVDIEEEFPPLVTFTSGLVTTSSPTGSGVMPTEAAELLQSL